MPKGRDTIRHVYLPSNTMCVILVNPVLRKHVETVRRRYAEASWTIDARIDPVDRNVIVVTHDGSITYRPRLQTRSSDLARRIRDNPPSTVEPLGPDSLARATVTPLPRPTRTAGSDDTTYTARNAPTTAVATETANLQLTGVQPEHLSDIIITVLSYGYAVDVTTPDGTTVRVQPK